MTPELGTLLFQIAHSLFALEWLLISAAKEQLKKMSDEMIKNCQNSAKYIKINILKNSKIQRFATFSSFNVLMRQCHEI